MNRSIKEFLNKRHIPKVVELLQQPRRNLSIAIPWTATI